jgi:hypothetical protein
MTTDADEPSSEDPDVLEQPRPRRKGIYILPNLFTLAALFGGFYAIVMAMNGHFDKAAIGVFAAMVLDSAEAARNKADPDFQWLVTSIAATEKLRQQKSLSLNLAQRKQERESLDAERLRLENQRRGPLRPVHQHRCEQPKE